MPAIRQFLQQNRDLSLDELKGSSPVGYGTLRTGMFDALRQIGGPEAQAALGDTLRATADPAEIGLLGRHLEEMAPGQYRNDAVQAARETLAQVAEEKSRAEVAPLFQVLQRYGDASVLADIEKAVPQWQHYGLMAMAGMPEGQGVQALIEQTDRYGGTGGARVFAVQMLAQVAPTSEDARTKLVNLAETGQIPERAWSRISEALSGDQYQFIKDPNVDNATLLKTPGTKTYHINGNNENFYSTPLPAGITEEERSQRTALIDQLLKTNPNAAAAEELQKAKARLTNKPAP